MGWLNRQRMKRGTQDGSSCTRAKMGNVVGREGLRGISGMGSSYKPERGGVVSQSPIFCVRADVGRGMGTAVLCVLAPGWTGRAICLGRVSPITLSSWSHTQQRRSRLDRVLVPRVTALGARRPMVSSSLVVHAELAARQQ